MKTLFKPGQYFDEDYYERGAETGKSLYSHYRWMPELTIPMCHHIAKYLELKETDKVGLVIIDGVADLLNDINDLEKSNKSFPANIAPPATAVF